MRLSPELLKSFEMVYRAVGPLRYQMAMADCVPTTVINALLFISRKHIPHRLSRLIWACSLDQAKGTGFVCSQILADVLQAWFTRAESDGEPGALSKYQSKVIESRAPPVDQVRSLTNMLIDRGVACITTDNGGHYSLIHSHDEGKRFYGFNPTWSKRSKESDALKLSRATSGIVNMIWTREELLSLLANRNNQFIHVIARRSKGVV